MSVIIHRPSGTIDTIADPIPRMEIELGGLGTYKRYRMGRYPDGTGAIPAAHLAAGIVARDAVEPLDTLGSPDPLGKQILIFIGPSQETRAVCHKFSGGEDGGLVCDATSVMGIAAAYPTFHPDTVFVNGARSGQDMAAWDDPAGAEYDRIENDILPNYDDGYTQNQVQIACVWLGLKDAPDDPVMSPKGSQIDTEHVYLQMEIAADVARALKVRYPNLQQTFFRSQIYGGYQLPTQNTPTPYSYESGFALKWLEHARMIQADTGVQDWRDDSLDNATPVGAVLASTGDLITDCSWIGQSINPWADGASPNRDGLVWERADYEDTVHLLSPGGQFKMATVYWDWLRTDELTSVNVVSFTPAELANLWGHFEYGADEMWQDAGTTPGVSGDPLGQWDAKYGAATPLTATGSARPTIRADYVEADGIANVMSAVLAHATYPVSLYARGVATSSIGGIAIRESANQYLHCGWDDDQPQMMARNTSREDIVDSPSAVEQNVLAEFISATERNLYVDDVLIGTDATSVTMVNGSTVQAFSAANAEIAAIDVKAFGVILGGITTADRARLNTYLDTL